MNLDTPIAELVPQIKRTYEVILDNMTLPKINAKRDVLVEIAQAMQECAQFIAKYSDITNFCAPLTAVFATMV